LSLSLGVRAVLEQPCQQLLVQRRGRDVQRRPSFRARCVDQCRRRLHQRDRLFRIAGGDCLRQLIVRWRIGAALCFAATLFFFFDDADDVVVAAFDGEGEGVCCVAVRIQSWSKVGAMLHEQTGHLWRALEHSVVQRPEIVGRHLCELGTPFEHRLYFFYVAGAHRFNEAFFHFPLFTFYFLLSTLGFNPPASDVSGCLPDPRSARRDRWPCSP
jgi:hypothetical protein